MEALTTPQSSTNTKGVKNLKTEYKSKFTPFDQYVYNEATDSFVKQQHHQPSSSVSPSTDCLQPVTISVSKSDQDLASHATASPTNVSISTQDASIYDSNAGMDGNGANAEPWYREVQKRNEKASEYRFKSEVGHNSPLLNYNRDESPFSPERQLYSPSGPESLNAEQNKSDNKSQLGDASRQPEVKQTYRFTPSDYKRDHLIAHMANNNNFNLPKEDSNNKVSGKRTVRPAARSTAQVRARSQSSRRVPPASTATTPKPRPAVKSNQTTPTKTVAKTSFTHSTARTSPTVAKPKVASVAASRAPTSTSRVSATASRRVPLSSSNSTGATKPPARAAPSSSTLANRSTPNATARSTSANHQPVKPTLRTSTSKTTTVSARPPTAVAPATKISNSPRLTSATPRGRTPTHSAKPIGKSVETTPKSDPQVKSPAPSTVKSIKTPKAIEAAKAKAESAKQETKNSTDDQTFKQSNMTAGEVAAGAVLASAIVATGAGIVWTDSNSEQSSKEALEQQFVPEQQPVNFASEYEQTVPMQMHHEIQFSREEPNLIFTTTEAGNMLADELAQAEMAAASDAYKTDQLDLTQIEKPTTEMDKEIPNDNIQLGGGDLDLAQNYDANDAFGSDKLTNDETLVNGLQGGLVSAEDRFDSSEREMNLSEIDEMRRSDEQTSSDQNQNPDDEPYSIMPTTFQKSKSESEDEDESKLGGQIVSESLNEADEFDKSLGVTDKPEDTGLVDLVSEDGGASGREFSNQTEPLKVAQSTLIQETSEKSELGGEVYDDDEKMVDFDRKASGDIETEARNIEQVMSQNDAFGDEVKDFLKGTSALNVTATESNLLEEAPSSQGTANLTDADIADCTNQFETFNIVSDHSPAGRPIDSKYTSDPLLDLASDEESNQRNFQDTPISGLTAGEGKSFDSDMCGNDTSGDKGQAALVGTSDDAEFTPKILDNNEKVIGTQNLLNTSAALTTPDSTIPSAEESFKSANDPEALVDFGSTDRRSSKSSLKAEKDLDLVDYPEAEPKDLARNSTLGLESVAEQEVGGNHPNFGRRGDELLMNVADLMNAESRQKEELARRAELARENSSPSKVEVLSADQLAEQIEKVSSQRLPANADAMDAISGMMDEKYRNDDDRDFVQKSDSSSSSTPTQPKINEQIQRKYSENSDLLTKNPLHGEQETSAARDQNETLENSKAQESTSGSSSDLLARGSGATLGLGATNLDDDIESDEHLKLSNHLTNSDDEFILEPRNLSNSEPQAAIRTNTLSDYNEQAAINLLADRVDETVELADGSSANAGIESPTLVENRVEMSTSRSIGSEHSATASTTPQRFMISQKLAAGDSDDEVNLDGTSGDPIGAAAKIDLDSGNTGELLRFNAVTNESLHQDLFKGDSGEMVDADMISKFANSSGTQDLIGSMNPCSVDVTSNMIDDTVKQIHQQHGDLHRQLNMSPKERKASATIDESILRRQQSKTSRGSESSSSSASSSEDQRDAGDDVAVKGSEDPIAEKQE